MPLSCGMTTGNVYCGTVGSPLRQEYAAIGDVVNLAARLMSKAKRTVYIDEGSYSRLPEMIQSKLVALPEIVVKGKDEPMRPFKYFDIEDSFDFKDISFTVDTFPIRSACKDAFVGLLKYLKTTEDPNRSNHHHLFPTRENYVAKPDHMSFIVIEGPAGTGRGQALAWLKHNADNNEVRAIAIALSKMDAVIDYSALTKLFRLFLRDENFDNEARQTNMINQLLVDIYPKDRETLEKVAYPTMRSVLGVTCQLRGNNGRLLPFKTIRKIPSSIMFQCLSDIFQFLFSEQPVVVTVENVQFVDELSWQMLHEISRFELKSAFVMSCSQITLPTSIKINSVVDHYAAPNVSYGWIEHNLSKLLAYKITKHIILETYTFNEVS